MKLFYLACAAVIFIGTLFAAWMYPGLAGTLLIIVAGDILMFFFSFMAARQERK